LRWGPTPSACQRSLFARAGDSRERTA